MTCPTLLLITGASRGLGAAIAKSFCKQIDTCNPLKVLLVARSDLKDCKEAMMDVVGQKSDSIQISLFTMDLSNLTELDANIDGLIKEAQPISQFEKAIIVNNAGSLGYVGLATNMASLEELQTAVNLNVTSSMWMTNRFSKELQQCKDVTVVNISSLCAIQSFPTMATYCAGKAARDMFSSTLAKENSTIKYLNYAPGALETDMTSTLIASTELDRGLHEFFQTSHEKGDLILPDKTADKLVQLVLRGAFENGAHIDFWDIDDDGKKISADVAAS